MNRIFPTTAPAAAAKPRPGPAKPRGSLLRAQLLASGVLSIAGSLVLTGAALAQTAASSGTGTLGAQLNKMSGEAVDSLGTGAGMVCYVLALVCFIGGVWALWQSRQPQNRESGYIAKGAAGLVLCGLFVVAPNWINKAAQTTAGNDATVNNTPAQIKFAP